MIGPIVERFLNLSDNFSFIPVSTTCYDDPTKDYSGRAASKVVLDNQTHVKETSLKLSDELRSNLILKTGGTESVQMILHQKDIGDDIQIGELVLQKNVRLGSAELGLLATIGLQIIHVYEKPHVVILSTDSNKIMLMNALKDLNIQHTIFFQSGIIYNK
ncbi:unnamed protein product [Rotaria magnacalcarata]|uniref:Uncharacterized protein n=1 Tax=Rotaria magnacalcarata TaxID=392030 RepID=A0A816M6Z6_9BILA|nr:unnamed protein product [Rotaria magnacalcarata]